MNDLRVALRQWAKAPGLFAVVICTLAVGIGTATAVFSVVNGVLLRPLDYREPERLVMVREIRTVTGAETSCSAANFRDWEKQATTMTGLTAYVPSALALTGEGEPERLVTVRATARYFEVFGVQPGLGRGFLAAEDEPGRNRVVVISHAFWQRRRRGAPDVLGSTLELNGEPFAIIGVAPPGFGESNRTDLWVPMAFTRSETDDKNRGWHSVSVVGRLQPGATLAQADGEMKLLAGRLAREFPDTNRGWDVVVMPYLEYYVRDIRPMLRVLLGAVVCVLLVACANVANLLLARTTARQHEFSIKAALGASPWQLSRPVLVESLLLAALGGVAGLILGQWSLQALLAFAPPGLPRSNAIRLDATVVMVSLAGAVGCGVLFGTGAAWLAGRANIDAALKQQRTGRSLGGRPGRWRRALVVFEIAVAFALLTGAGLCGFSFMRLAAVNPGFVPENAVDARITLSARKYSKPEQQIAFAEAVLAQVRGLPGVRAAGVSQSVPLANASTITFSVEGRPALPASEEPSTNLAAVTSGYFEAMGIRLSRGRAFDGHDNDQAKRVAVVSETFARQQFPSEEPIGRRINISKDPNAWLEIVGVVADVAQYGLDRDPPSHVYVPFAQRPATTLHLVVRRGVETDKAFDALRPAIYAVDRNQPVDSLRPLDDLVSSNLRRQRFSLLLFLVFSGASLAIAGVGVFGVMAYDVAQRTGEIGVRMALGADESDVMRLILGDGGRVVTLGWLLGLAATFTGARAMQAMLFHTPPQSPLVLALASITLGMTALLGCWIPARRAMKIAPVRALRGE